MVICPDVELDMKDAKKDERHVIRRTKECGNGGKGHLLHKEGLHIDISELGN